MNSDIESITSQEWVRALLARPVLARLATADPRSGQPHVVPVWFEWADGCIWISSFCSTRKNREVQRNPRVAVAIDEANGPNSMEAVLFEGWAEIIADPQVVIARSTRIYSRYLGEEGVKAPDPASWIVDPENRIICIHPEKVFASRQT
jgi:PPOX class probable F420-dependent enzyme